MTQLEARQLAIVIVNAENFINTLLNGSRATVNAIEVDLKTCYKTEQAKRLAVKFDEICSNWKSLAKTAEEIKSVVEEKRNWLIQSEGENVFSGIQVETVKTSGLPI